MLPKGLTEPLARGLSNGASITFQMVKVIVPFYILSEFIKQYGLTDEIGRLFKPAMAVLGLPGEAALALIAGYLVNLYAAIAVLVPLNLSGKDMTVIALMLGIAHSLTIETPITRQAGGNAWILLLVRLVVSIFSGIVLNALWRLF